MVRLAVPHAATAFADQALVSGANFLVMVAVGRCATPADFALFSLAYTVAVFIGGMHTGLVLQPLGMLLPERASGEKASYLAALVRLHMTALPPLLVAAAVAWVIAPHGDLIAWTVVATWCRLAQENERRTAYALHDSRRALAIDAAACLPMAAIAGMLIGLRPSISANTGLAVLAGTSLLGIAAGRMLLATSRAATAMPLGPLLREHWHVGRWLVAGSVMCLLADYLYPFLVAGYLGLEETALLAAARSVISAGNVAINGMDAYAGPRLRAIRVHEGLDALRRAALRFAAILLLILGCICLPLMIAPRVIMEITFGPHYGDGAWILVAFVGIFLIRAVNKIFGLMLLALKRPSSGFIAICINSVVTVLAGPPLVRHFGLKGVVAALAVNALVILIVMAAGTWRAWRQDCAESESQPVPGLPDVN